LLSAQWNGKHWGLAENMKEGDCIDVYLCLKVKARQALHRLFTDYGKTVLFVVYPEQGFVRGWLVKASDYPPNCKLPPGVVRYGPSSL
jgi:hypothetical protein